MNGWVRLGECAHNSAPRPPLNGAIHAPARSVDRQIWREGCPGAGSRTIPEETAVAVTYNGGTYAVMMATPQDLEDFAIGFSLTEGVIDRAADIESLDIVRLDDGVELRMWLAKPKADRLRARQRHIAGPTGCGLCGIESIAEAIRPAAVVRRGRQFSPEHIMAAMQSLPSRQKLNLETRAVHAAAFWNLTSSIVALREDVGRHNALDKLSGALARASVVVSEGIILLTSRVSVEMVQKSAAIGAPVVASVSAPTALAVRMAAAAGITLAAIARADGFEVFTHPSRIAPGAADNTAVTAVTRRRNLDAGAGIRNGRSSEPRRPRQIKLNLVESVDSEPTFASRASAVSRRADGAFDSSRNDTI